MNNLEKLLKEYEILIDKYSWEGINLPSRQR